MILSLHSRKINPSFKKTIGVYGMLAVSLRLLPVRDLPAYDTSL